MDKVKLIELIIAAGFILTGCIIFIEVLSEGTVSNIINTIFANFLQFGFSIILVNLGVVMLTLNRR